MRKNMISQTDDIQYQKNWNTHRIRVVNSDLGKESLTKYFNSLMQESDLNLKQILICKKNIKCEGYMLVSDFAYDMKGNYTLIAHARFKYKIVPDEEYLNICKGASWIILKRVEFEKEPIPTNDKIKTRGKITKRVVKKRGSSGLLVSMDFPRPIINNIKYL